MLSGAKHLFALSETPRSTQSDILMRGQTHARIASKKTES